MDAFDRSAPGRNNRALFYGVDRIVYVEGGRDDKGAMESFDGLFWRRVFSVIRPEIRLRLLPRGSKTTLLGLADLINNDDNSNVIVAMDRDYDGLFNRTISHGRIVYTHGYSFENDIFSPEILEELFLSVCPVVDDSVDVSDTISDLVVEFCDDVWWTQFADVCGGVVARKVIDRGHVQKYMMNNVYGAKPKLSKSALAIDVYKANCGGDRVKVKNIPLKKHHLPHLSVGHLYASFCYKIIAYLHFLHSNTAKLTKDSVLASAISNFSVCLATKPLSVVGTYYRNALVNC